jgi:hypothetical protein
VYWNILKAARLYIIEPKPEVLIISSVSINMVDVSLLILLMGPENISRNTGFNPNCNKCELPRKFICTLTHIFSWYKSQIRGGADKSLARPIFRCRRTKSLVSLERGVYSCAELQVVSCYRGRKETCQATRAISTTSRREMSSSPPPGRQGAEVNSRHSDKNIRETRTIVCHLQKLGGPV